MNFNEENNMKRLLIAALLTLGVLSAAQAGDGLITKKSHHSVTVTLDRLEAVLKEKGITIVTRWSHDAGAKKADLPLRPTGLLIFGNPKLGTPLMISNQAAGIDLPLKALAWEDDKGGVWLTYNDPAYIANRHGIKDRDEVVKKMQGALAKFTDKATAADAAPVPEKGGDDMMQKMQDTLKKLQDK